MASGDARIFPTKNTAFRCTFPIFDADGDLVTGATGLDSEISKDGGTFADCTNEATEIATSSGMYYLDLTNTEMNADTVAIIVKTSSTGAKTTPMVFYPVTTTVAQLGVNAVQIGATVQTGRDIGTSVLLSSGTGTGQISLSSGAVLLQATQTGVTIPTVTTVTNQLTAAAIATGIWQDATAGDFTTASSIGKALYIANVAPGAAGGHFIAGTNAATSITTALTANITGNLSGSVGSVTGAVGSVTGAVGSVTGAVGSVTGSVGSIAANGITATSMATDSLTAGAVTAAAVTKIQNGLATPTNITAGTITTVTNLTNAPTAGDLTATMKTSVTTAATAATPVLSATGVANIWAALTSGLTTAGSIGKLIVDNLNATVSSRSTYAGADTSGTTTLLSRIVGTLAAGTHNPQTGDAYARLGAPAGASIAADLVVIDNFVDDLETRLTTTRAGYLDQLEHIHDDTAGLSTLLTGANGVAAIKADTAAIKVKTDQFVFTVANQVDANALSGGGGLDAAGVRSAVGLASANLDTQLADIPTVAEMNARTLVSAGYASPTNITAGTITTVTNLTNAASAGDFTATMKTSLNAATPAVTVSDKTGFSLSTAGILAIWHQLTSAIVTASTIGKLIVDNLNAAITTRSTYAGADTSGTTTLLTRIVGTLAAGTHNPQTGDAYARLGAPAGASVSADVAAIKVDSAAIKLKTDNLPTDPADESLLEAAIAAIPAAPTAAANADAVWDEALSGHATAGTAGKKLTDLVNTDISSIPTDAENAAAVLAAAALAPIDANIKEVNDVTITGTGAVGSDEWRAV